MDSLIITVSGALVRKSPMVTSTCRRVVLVSAISAGLGCIVSAAAAAEPVKIRTVDGDLSFTAQVLDYDDTTLRVSTPFGERVLDRDLVICAGASCPSRDIDAS